MVEQGLSGKGEVMAITDYRKFLESKSQWCTDSGFDPGELPGFLFDFQKYLVEWACRKGRAAIFADTGLGKTAMQLVWADKVRHRTGGNVLLLTPLAVGKQTAREAERFGIEVSRCQDGKHSGGIVVTNYERLHYFEPTDFVGVVCDESSILKGLSGATRRRLTRFMSKLQYRLLCTATAAPNDWVELGTSSEALGELSHSEMLRRFFRQLDDKGQKKELREQYEAESLIESDPNYFKKLAYRVSQTIGQWRLKHHAIDAYWQWVASWAIACRKPSDLGFGDEGFDLPELIERDHVIATPPAPGYLFSIPAVGMGMEREERRRTLRERCEFVAQLVKHDRQALVWCHMNDEGDMLERVIPDAAQVAGRTPDERKEELYEAFADGRQRVLVLKPKIGAWGMNWQNCNHVVSFASHSWEQAYQSVRRCYRYGQKRPVTVDMVATEGEVRVLANMRRKGEKAREMFDRLIREVNRSQRIEREDIYTKEVEVPRWLS